MVDLVLIYHRRLKQLEVSCVYLLFRILASCLQLYDLKCFRYRCLWKVLNYLFGFEIFKVVIGLGCDRVHRIRAQKTKCVPLIYYFDCYLTLLSNLQFEKHSLRQNTLQLTLSTLRQLHRLWRNTNKEKDVTSRVVLVRRASFKHFRLLNITVSHWVTLISYIAVRTLAL